MLLFVSWILRQLSEFGLFLCALSPRKPPFLNQRLCVVGVFSSGVDVFQQWSVVYDGFKKMQFVLVMSEIPLTHIHLQQECCSFSGQMQDRIIVHCFGIKALSSEAVISPSGEKIKAPALLSLMSSLAADNCCFSRQIGREGDWHHALKMCPPGDSWITGLSQGPDEDVAVKTIWTHPNIALKTYTWYAQTRPGMIPRVSPVRLTSKWLRHVHVPTCLAR